MIEVILVDEKNNNIGVEEKLKAHQEGKLHRAFSIFIFNKKGEFLLQKRAKTKYHSPGLWSNTCDSHPRPNHNLKEEAKRRLREEIGINCDLKEIFSFHYKAKVEAKVEGLIEHEIDHVFSGEFNGEPKPNEKEVEEWKWINFKDLKRDLKENPEKYAVWFRIILDEYSMKLI